MSTPNVLQSDLIRHYQAFRRHFWLWATPTVLITLCAAMYASIRPTEWKASQALIVRDEAIGNTHPQGRFDSTESRKAFQETVLEVARSRVVVLGALTELGPPAGRHSTQAWPSEEEVESFQDRITVNAPKGAEFGSTEVIYLSALGATRHEATERAKAVCDQLEIRLSDLRNAKTASVIIELESTLDLALNDLEEATKNLEEIERQVGSDLGELRILNDSGAGDSNLRRTLDQVKTELRQVRTGHDANEQLKDLLVAAQEDPNQLLATPTRLLESQPALRRLKDGLVDAQLRTAELRGKMSENHPAVVAALGGEDEVRQNILAELASALRGNAADLKVSQQQLRSFEQQHNDLQSRLDRLASLRVRYGNLVDDLHQRTEIVNQAKQNLADARASLGASRSISLLTRFHGPVAAERPEGPGRLTIIAGGLFSGLMTGIGLVFLALPSGSERSRRWSDLLPIGRRSSDQLAASRTQDPADSTGRRAADLVVPRRVEDNAQDTTAERRGSRGRRAEDQG